MTKLTRSARVTFAVLNGQDILDRGHETARHLWNQIWWCAIEYNRRLHRQRIGYYHERIITRDNLEKSIRFLPSLKGKLPPYIGKWGIDREMRDYWAAQELSSRCFSYIVREFDIAMRSWFTNLRANPDTHPRPPRYCSNPRQLTFEIGRNAKHLGNWEFRLTVLGGHITPRHAVVRIHLRPGIKVQNVKLIRIQPDGTGTIVYYTQSTANSGDGIAAIDLGIVNIACLAFQDGTSVLYSGRGVLSSDQWFQKRAARCKPSNWQGRGHQESRQSKRLRRYRRKAGNIRHLAVHNLTRNIIDECVKRGVGTLVVGDLTGIRQKPDGMAKNYGKKTNQKLHAWPFAEIRRQLEYKGQEANIEVIAISERNTSRTCHACGVISKSNRVQRGLYECLDCGIAVNADVNGAFNILNKVSPIRAQPLGSVVEAALPGLPSPPEPTAGIGKVHSHLSQIHPTIIRKFDLRNWSIVQVGCNYLREPQ